MSNPPPAQPSPSFDRSAPHLQRPRLRPLRAFPAQAQTPDGKLVTVLGLADARQISDRVVMTAPAVQNLLPKLDGEHTLDQIVSEVGRGLSREMLEGLVVQFDEAGLIEGPTFQRMLDKMKADFDASDVLPPASTASFAEQLVGDSLGESASEDDKLAEGAKRMAAIFDQYIDKALENADNPSLDELPAAIMAPHLDYPRGWLNYGASYGRLRVVDRPDRVIILGTNHFGEATGVCGCDKGYSTPFGVCEADTDLIADLRARLGDRLFAQRYDHEREHSIELQVAWIQHVFGEVQPDGSRTFPRIFGALIHDPTVNNGQSYDGAGIGLDEFVAALRAAVTARPGRTLIVSSADLSHVGPAFGDPKTLAGDDEETAAARNRVLQHDQEMLELIRQNKPDELITAMSWQQNPTRWCSIGNIIATLKTVNPGEIELFNYAAAMDQQGMSMVSSASMAMRT